jgi:hypothetical protein
MLRESRRHTGLNALDLPPMHQVVRGHQLEQVCRTLGAPLTVKTYPLELLGR